ncbi:MAG: hypothetical protein GC188_05905 [Alphaproteobacteria bacterium]|nr:hypothetical protein [Alphaproteobacteria bacterium]
MRISPRRKNRRRCAAGMGPYRSPVRPGGGTPTLTPPCSVQNGFMRAMNPACQTGPDALSARCRGPIRVAVSGRWMPIHMSVQAYDCVACGACCFSRHPRYLVLLPEDAGRALPPDQLFEEGGRTFMDFSCGHCAHLQLDTGQAICGVYEQRPEACRAFRAGSFECQRAIRANGVMGERVREKGVA